jgi:hypothetical protein
MTTTTKGKKKVLTFGDFIAASYQAWAVAGRKDLCGWPSTRAWLSFEGSIAL